MDKSMFKAAWNGDVDYLHNAIATDPSALHTVALANGETPLHTACLAGHLDFVAPVIKLRQEFCRELNRDGFSPLHIASACGHLEIVQELLRVDCNLCLIKGKERRISLHFAVIKGKVEVVRELLAASVDSIGSVTARGETALHLAVKNNQFEVFQVLVEHIKQFKKEDMLNLKDDQGNTILHLAVSRKQYEVVGFLLNEQVFAKGIMDLNSLNKRSLTPLDVLLLFESEAGDREIEEILWQAGAEKAGDLQSSAHLHETQNQPASTNSLPTNGRSRRSSANGSPAKQLLDYFQYDRIKDSPSKVRNTLLVIVILIATATYQAVLSPPGGVWLDDYNTPFDGNNTSNTNTSTTKPHTAGKAVMGTHNPVAYSLFLFTNSVGFFMSLYMISVLTAAFPLRLELLISIIALSSTYDICMGAIGPTGFLTIFIPVVYSALPFMIPLSTMVVRNYLKRPTDELR